MDRPFLDANVLFSAAYRADSGLSRLWALPDARLVTSHYAAAEARRNLATSSQQSRLDPLVRGLDVVPEAPERTLPQDLDRPEKDRPILQAAIAARATHLLTGDATHSVPTTAAPSPASASRARATTSGASDAPNSKALIAAIDATPDGHGVVPRPMIAR